ncbi:MAG: hypothetical protein U0Q07_16765 [Acidimicrobiales bacterium]
MLPPLDDQILWLTASLTTTVPVVSAHSPTGATPTWVLEALAPGPPPATVTTSPT